MAEDPKKTQYDELKDERQKTLVKEYEDFLMAIKVKISKRNA